MILKLSWWKILTIILLIFSLLAGFLGSIPQMPTGNLYETARNLYFHVPMWFAMSFWLLASCGFAVMYLRTRSAKYNFLMTAATEVSMIFGALGLITGAIWARFTWGAYWHGDPKQTGAAIAMLIYLAFFVLKSAMEDKERSATVAAIYNILAFFTYIPLIYVLPRLVDSMHPGNGGNPGFNVYDLAAQMRPVFYPSVIAWILMGGWITTLRKRMWEIEEKINQTNNTKTIEVIS